MQVYGLIGSICLILGVVLALCTFLPSTPVAPAYINLIAGSMLILLGFGLRRLARVKTPAKT
jgi:SSS family solute:Na+ symporter